MQLQHGSAADIRDSQNCTGKYLGQRRGSRRSRYSPSEGIDKNRIQHAVQETSGAHPQHGIGGAALAAQELVHDQIGCGKGGCQQYPSGIPHGIIVRLLCASQQIDQRLFQCKAYQCKQQGKGTSDGERRGCHIGRFFVLTRAHKPRDIAGGTHGKAHSYGTKDVHQRIIDCNGGRGSLPQTADKEGICQIVQGINNC